MTIISAELMRSSAEERGKRIQFIRKHLLNYSREQFCTCIFDFVTPQTLKSWELAWGNGLTEKGAKQITQRVKELGIYCSVMWLLHGIGKEPSKITQDVKQSVILEEQIAKEILLFREQGNTIDTIVSDDAMVPLLYPGNYIGGVIVDNIEDAIDKDCIIVDLQDEIYVRILKKEPNLPQYNLLALNPNPLLTKRKLSNISIKFVAPIIFIRKVESQKINTSV